MKKLALVTATPEQLPIISNQRLGPEVIRGAAGSGKTSTALLRMQSLKFMIEARKARADDTSPVRILVLTFNRTLSGYVSSLAEAQQGGRGNVSIEISTFAKWAIGHLTGRVVNEALAKANLSALVQASTITALSPEYISEEVDYVMGRFARHELERYIDIERTGRGSTPRVVSTTRRALLDEVIYPYISALDSLGVMDWNTLATEVLTREVVPKYDVVVIDEAQDFSANQLRAVMHAMNETHASTFVIDTAQRIYARGFTWSEAGINVSSGSFYKLIDNHRNTVQIARFVLAILAGINIDSDGALPDLTTAYRTGSVPHLLSGGYEQQIDWAINFIGGVDLTEVSVAFLAPLGGGWLTYLKQRLTNAGIRFADITRNVDWPQGGENVAICTFHSAKGLEFDHVFILGLADRNAGQGQVGLDDKEQLMRRLFAVASARARDTLVIGYKPGEESFLLNFVDRTLVQETLL